MDAQAFKPDAHPHALTERCALEHNIGGTNSGTNDSAIHAASHRAKDDRSLSQVRWQL